MLLFSSLETNLSSKGKVTSFGAKLVHTAGASPTPDYPSIWLGCPNSSLVPIYITWLERGTVRVKCLAQEHNTMTLACRNALTLGHRVSRLDGINVTEHLICLNQGRGRTLCSPWFEYNMKSKRNVFFFFFFFFGGGGFMLIIYVKTRLHFAHPRLFYPWT